MTFAEQWERSNQTDVDFYARRDAARAARREFQRQCEIYVNICSLRTLARSRGMNVQPIVQVHDEDCED